MAQLRPQVLASIISATIVSIVILMVGLELKAVEVVTGVTGAIFGFLAGVSIKILESD